MEHNFLHIGDGYMASVSELEGANYWISLNPYVNYAIEAIEEEIYLATGVHTNERTRAVLEDVLHKMLWDAGTPPPRK